MSRRCRLQPKACLQTFVNFRTVAPPGRSLAPSRSIGQDYALRTVHDAIPSICPLVRRTYDMLLPMGPLSKPKARIFRVFLGLCCAWIAFLGSGSSTAHASQHRVITHVVQKKQNLGMIAKRYHTSPGAIRKANSLRRGQKLKVGQRLRVPEVEAHRKWLKYLDRKWHKCKWGWKYPVCSRNGWKKNIRVCY